MIQVHFNKLVDGSMWLVGNHGIHACYQTQATHYAKGNRLIPIGEDETIPCSIPQELVDAINNVLYWYAHYSTTDPSTSHFAVLQRTLSKSLQGQCTMHQSLQRQQELEEAERLLIEVCETFEELDPAEAYECIDDLNVKGLIAWWVKRKPKSEREKKLEKISTILNASGYILNHSCQLHLSETILKALEAE